MPDILPFSEENPDAAARVRPIIAVTLGDPNGIGPEVVLQCLSDSRLLKFMRPVVVGSAEVLRVHAERLGYKELKLHVVASVPKKMPEEGITVLDVAPNEHPRVEFGQITEAGGDLAMRAVERATDLCLAEQADAIVTAPISKEAISRAGYKFPGHTEFIAERTGASDTTMMMVAGNLRVGLATGHIPIWDVPRAVTVDGLLRKIRIIHESLVVDYGVMRPRIAVLGLNPHAGDGGIIGREEIEVIIPAIQRACEEGFLVLGPFPADGFFAVSGFNQHDAVLAMYHDQGLIPFKALAFDSGVNFTAGLPIVRTSPDHGTAYDIAGQGKASPGSMRSAIYLAVDVARRRVAQQKQRLAG